MTQGAALKEDRSSKSLHSSHILKCDPPDFYVVCVNCGSRDETPHGWGKLAETCPNLSGIKTD